MTKKRTTTAPAGWLGYVRVSTGEQLESGLGLEAQRSAIRSACEARGWDLARIYEDAASGGSMNGRAGLAEALDMLAAGQAAGLVVAKLDRLSRSLADFAALMERAHKEGWALAALDLNVDTTSPAGEMLCNVLASFAQYERRLIGLRTREALAELQAQGVKLGRPRSIDEDVVARMFELKDSGMSYRAIADQLNDEGLPTGQGGTWHHTTVYRAMKSRAVTD